MQPLPLIAILAGGRSRRLGTDKATLPIGETTWLERIVRAAQATGCTVAVVGRSGTDVPPDAPSGEPAGALDGVAFVPDEAPGLGPMGGLLTALRHADACCAGAPVLLAGCDMPFLTTAAFDWLLDRVREGTGSLGLVARSESGLEPLFACYRPAARPVVERRIAQRRLSLQELLTEPAFRIVPVPGDVRDALHNINTPEDRQRFGL